MICAAAKQACVMAEECLRSGDSSGHQGSSYTHGEQVCRAEFLGVTCGSAGHFRLHIQFVRCPS